MQDNLIKGLFFVMHTKCNFSCSYCWQRNNKTALERSNPHTFLQIIDFFFENYFLFYPKDTEITFYFSGGESLLYQKELIAYIQRIYSYQNVCNIKPIIYIQTNGSLITQELLAQLQPYNIIFQISYDGKKTNARNNPELIYKKIQLTGQYFPVYINSIFTVDTLQYIYDTYQELLDLPIQQWGFGLNFLEAKQKYNLQTLAVDLSKISEIPHNFCIKNFCNCEDKNFFLAHLIQAIHTITITPAGQFISTAYLYNDNIYSFGNYTNNFDYGSFLEYSQKKSEQIFTTYKNMPSLTRLDIKSVITNL